MAPLPLNQRAALDDGTASTPDPNQSSARSQLRYRRVRWSVLANVLARGMAMLLMVCTVRLTLPYLGAERFGAWMLLASFVAMLSFMDLGIGNALTNRVAAAAATDDAAALRRATSAGLLVLLAASSVIGTLLAVISHWLPWSTILRSSSSALEQETRDAALVFALTFAISMYCGGVQKVFLGIQRSFEAHLAMAAATAMALAMLWLASQQQAGITVLLATVSSAQLICAAVLTVLLVRRGMLGLDPDVRSSIAGEMPHLLRMGALFFLLQIGTMVGWGADSLIISTTLGASQVATYSVAQRLFQFASVPVGMISQPLWGAYADAHARRDHEFIRTTLRRSLLVTVPLSLLLVSVLVLIAEPVVAAWTKHTVTVPLGLLLVWAAWTVLESTAASAAMYLNGCNVVRPQVAAVLTFCAMSIPLKFLLADAYGLIGVVACTIVAYLIAVPVLYAMFFRSEVTAPLRQGSA